ncbi:MAG: NAD(P)-dependent oxidoreductase [Chloroflexi bacterium]|nr:NAD(P)-dependent oxidoreductase [Chloroflexota bacterium]
MPDLRLGYVGVGAMGLPMALNLRKAGFPVAFVTGRSAAAEPLLAAGATRYATARAVTEASDAVCLCVPADAEIDDSLDRADGILAGLAPGGVVIEMSTASPGVVQRAAVRAAARGGHVLDVPVSGGVTGAQKGTLTLMVGGDAAVLERCRPALAAMGTNIYHVGPVGMGKVFKIINNMLGGVQAALAAEALALGVRAGADLGLLHEVVKVSSGDSAAWRGALPALAAGEDGPVGFKLALMRKDVGLALQLGRDSDVPLTIASAGYQQYAAASANGLNDRNSAEVGRVIERLLGMRFTT